MKAWPPLPSATKKPKDPKPKVNYVTVESTGRMFLNNAQVDIPTLQEKLVAMRIDDPDLNVVIRGSAKTKYQNIVNVMSVLQQANVGKANLATDVIAEGAPKGKE